MITNMHTRRSVDREVRWGVSQQLKNAAAKKCSGSIKQIFTTTFFFPLLERVFASWNYGWFHMRADSFYSAIKYKPEVSEQSALLGQNKKYIYMFNYLL